MEKMYRQPLGEILVKIGALTRRELERALEEQRPTHAKLGEVLISLDLVAEEQITEARALQLDVAYINLQDREFSPEVISVVPESIARTYSLIPVELTDGRLTVAMVNPFDIEAIDLLHYETKYHIVPGLATEWRIAEAIDRAYGVAATEDLKDFMDQVASIVEVTPSDLDEDSGDIDEVRRLGDQAPIVRMVNILLTQAVRKKASDIHIEPKRNSLDVRYRLDGELYLIKSIPRRLYPAITSRIKIMSELDISERRLPQDGRITVRVDGRSIDLRVSINPTIYGERIVIRILDRAHGLIPLKQLGFSKRNLTIFEHFVSQPYGIILVTGPTGSGKTTTLYAALASLKSEHTNIMTVEDPVEYELDGISQTMVNAKIGLTFANQLRTILRQDPDTILVGEIRDTETADIAFRAAITGHLVFSTLHCNDAPSAATRLIDMGVEPFLVSSAIIGVQAQRLVRVLCKSCRKPYEPDEVVRTLLGLPHDQSVTLYRSGGCSECQNTGYKGRTIVVEIMALSDEIRRLILAKSPAYEIRATAIAEGMIDMRRDAVDKVLAGITSVEEIQRKVLFETDAYRAEESASGKFKAA